MTVDHTQTIETLKQYPPTPITPEMHIAEVARALMHENFLVLLTCEPDCRSGKHADKLEQMRSAARHLLTLLDILDPYLGHKKTRKLKKRLRKLLVAARNVRDLDAMMKDLLVYGEAADSRMTVAGIIAHMDAQRLVAQTRLVSVLDSKKYNKALAKLEALLIQPVSNVFELDDDPTAPHQARHVLPVVIHQQFAAVRAYEAVMQRIPADYYQDFYEETLKLRYLLSAFEPLLGKTVGDYQNELGRFSRTLEEISDINATLARLIRLPRISLASSQVQALKQYRKNLQARQEKRKEDIPEAWEVFNSRKVQEKLAQALLVLR